MYFMLSCGVMTMAEGIRMVSNRISGNITTETSVGIAIWGAGDET